MGMPVIETLKGIFGAGEVAQRIAKLAGLVEGIEGQLDLLLNAPLNAGMRMLEDARFSNSVEDRRQFIEAARVKFYEAAELEKKCLHRRALALIAIAACHAILDGAISVNCRRTLSKVIEIEPLEKARFVPSRANFSDKLYRICSLLGFSFAAAALYAGVWMLLSSVLKIFYSPSESLARFAVAFVFDTSVVVFVVFVIITYFYPEHLGFAREVVEYDLEIKKTSKLQLLVASVLEEQVPWMERNYIKLDDEVLRDR